MAEDAAGSAVEKASTGAKDIFTKKIGPAPVWVWAALGMGVLFVVSKNRRRQSTSSAASGNDVNTPVPDTFWPSTAVMPQGYVPSTDETNAEDYAIYTNEDWVVYAARKMASVRSDNTTVLKRLRQYVNGGTYPQDEYDATIAIAEEAIKVAGPPPEPVGPLSVAGTVPFPVQPGNGATPVVPGETEIPLNSGRDVYFTLPDFQGSLEAAAQHYYGDPSAWNKFRVWDPSRPDEGWLGPDGYQMLATGGLPPTTTLAATPVGRLTD